MKSYTEKRLSFSESTSIKKAPDNARVSLLVSSPESLVSCSSMFMFYLKAVAQSTVGGLHCMSVCAHN